MRKRDGMRFSVYPQNEDAALACFGEHGFRPLRVEGETNGLVTLVFPALPAKELHALVLAAPAHLSAKVGVVVGDRAPFSSANPNGS